MNRVEPTIYPVADSMAPGGPSRSRALLWTSLMILFKLRVVMLLLFAAIGGAFLAADGWPGIGDLALLLIAGGMAAAGASAINQYLEKDLDARMERTRRRPLVTQSLPRPHWVPYVGAAMILLPTLAVLPLNPTLSFFVLLGAAVYIVLYTIWLKPRTLLNIVIGGAAGSAAVLSGSAAAGAWSDTGALLLALLVFLWTPTHFWSLAIAYREDYARGRFPMLPVQTSTRTASWWILLHTSSTALTAMALVTQLEANGPFLILAGLASVGILALNLRLLADQSKQRALALFYGSNAYLAAVLLIICIGTLML